MTTASRGFWVLARLGLAAPESRAADGIDDGALDRRLTVALVCDASPVCARWRRPARPSSCPSGPRCRGPSRAHRASLVLPSASTPPCVAFGFSRAAAPDCLDCSSDGPVLVLGLPVVADLLGDVLDRRPRRAVRALLGVVLLVRGVERLGVGVLDLLVGALERPRQLFLLGGHTPGATQIEVAGGVERELGVEGAVPAAAFDAVGVEQDRARLAGDARSAPTRPSTRRRARWACAGRGARRRPGRWRRRRGRRSRPRSRSPASCSIFGRLAVADRAPGRPEPQQGRLVRVGQRGQRERSPPSRARKVQIRYARRLVVAAARRQRERGDHDDDQDERSDQPLHRRTRYAPLLTRT